MLDAAANRPRGRNALVDRLRGGGSDAPPGVCPPVVDYSRAEQVRMADEFAALTQGAVIVNWTADYAVLRDQARACAGR